MPSVDRRHWERFARSFLRRSRRRGIIAARDHRGHIRGLAIFRKEFDVTGPILNAEPVLFVDLLDSSEVALALIRALEAQGREAGCIEVRVCLSDYAETGWPASDLKAHLELRRRLTTSIAHGAAGPPDGHRACS